LRSRRLWEIRERVLKVLEELSEELGADVYLFGSYARGDHLLDSDVDVLVVSERFEGMAYVDRWLSLGASSLMTWGSRSWRSRLASSRGAGPSSVRYQSTG